MKDLISLIMLPKDNFDYIESVLNSINTQSYKSWELFILTDKKKSYLSKFANEKIKIVEKNFSNFNFIPQCLKLINGEFVVILNSSGILKEKALEKQLKFIKEKNLNIVSTLELPIDKKKSLVNSANISNSFITDSEIDFAISSYFLPINLYTLMIKKSFLNSIAKISSKTLINSSFDLILFFLRYSNIEKVPEILYLFKNPEIPHKEGLNLEINSKSKNSLVVFNRTNSLAYRNFLLSALKENSISPSSFYKLNVLIIIDSLNVGGTESYILSLAKELRNNSINSFILCLDGVFIDLFINNDFKVIKSTEIFNDYKNNLDSIENLIIKNNIKALVTHNDKGLKISLELKKKYPIALLSTLHGNFHHKGLIKESFNLVDKFIVVSKEIFNFYFYNLNDLNDLKKVSIIQNGVSNLNKPLKTPHYLKNDKKIIVYCSRLSLNKSKIAMSFLKSFEKLILNNDNLYGVIIGDGEYKKTIDNYIKKINSNNGKKIFSTGAISNVLDYYSNSFLVVGTGRVAIEAMSCFKPVISLGLQGFKSIVREENINSLLESNFGDHGNSLTSDKLGDYIEELTDSIQYLIDNPKEYKKLSNFSGNYINFNLNLKEISKKIAKIYFEKSKLY